MITNPQSVRADSSRTGFPDNAEFSSPSVRAPRGNGRTDSRGVEDECCLNLAKLDRLRHINGKQIAGCPACIEAGKDKARDNLAIFPNGYHCAAAAAT